MVIKNNTGRRQRERSEVRLKLLDAARDLFLSGGEEAVTLRRVAERIEYSATTIYLHFSNKEVLIHELCASDFATYSRALLQAERTTDPMLRLRKVATCYLDFGLLYPAHYRSMFMTPAGLRHIPDDQQDKGIPAVDETVASAKTSPAPPNPYDFLHTAVFKAMAAGCFKPQYRDVAMIAQVIWSGLHGVISLHLVRARYSSVTWRPVQAGAETMIECLLNGLTNGDANQIS